MRKKITFSSKVTILLEKIGLFFRFSFVLERLSTDWNTKSKRLFMKGGGEGGGVSRSLLRNNPLKPRL